MSVTFGRCGVDHGATKLAVFTAWVMLFAALGARAEATVIASEPPDGAIDARVPHSPGDASVAFGWDSIVVTIQGLASELAADDFTVTEEGGDGIPPIIIALTPVSADSWA